MSKRKEREAADKARQAAEQVARTRAILLDHLDDAKTFEGADAADVPDCSMQLRKGERIFLTAAGASLIEPRRSGGHWEGRSQGVSVRVPGTKSMRYRVGSNRGHFVQAEERPTPIDEGTFVVTSTRAVFMGMKQTREWTWAKLIGVTHAADAPWTAISVSNRQKTSGVLYDDEHADLVRFRLDLAIARSDGTTATLVSELEAEIAALPPADANTVSAKLGGERTEPARPASWLPDPAGRHELRYWNGSEWTEHVADAGIQAMDPPP